MYLVRRDVAKHPQIAWVGPKPSLLAERPRIQEICRDENRRTDLKKASQELRPKFFFGGGARHHKSARIAAACGSSAVV